MQLEATGQLEKLDAELDPTEQEFRRIYALPRALEWMTNTLPNLETDGFHETVQSPLEQADDLIYRFVSGDENVHDLPPHSMDGAVRRIRTRLSLDSDSALYSAQRPRHSERATARFNLNFDLE
jgi:hypothetical protein